MTQTPPPTAADSDLDPQLVTRLRQGAQALQPWLEARRRWFHRHPELGWQEVRTTARIVEDLRAEGYEVVAGADFLGDVARTGIGADPIPGEGETGCIALYDTGRPGPTVCMRVDIDALPILEAGGNHAPAAGGYASATPGVMHACGHDGHAAIGLGVARLLRPWLASGHGKLKLLFQPAEEGARGARAVAEAGWMADVDLFFAIHLGLGVPSRAAAFAVDGFLANARYRVRYRGQAIHAGKTPEGGRNALVAAAQSVLALQALAQSSRPGIRVNVGLLQAGTAVNIVPDLAEFEFEMRAAETADLMTLDARARALVEATAAAHGLECDMEPMGMAEGWTNPEEIARWAGAVNARTRAFDRELPAFFFGASEDATTLAGRVAARGGQAGIFVLGADLADDHHTPRFDFDEDALARSVLLGAGLIAAAMRLDPAEQAEERAG
ncbi:MAG: amidohydrolase [Pseudodonghicola sp.]